jgi:hypothetical protein
MNSVWVGVAVGIAGIIAVMVLRRKGAQDTELGFVSNQWVSEQRLSEHHNSQR